MKPFNNNNRQEVKFTENGQWGHHGDVWIMKTDLPENFDKLPKRDTKGVLAYGEATGHLHQLTEIEEDGYEMREDPESNLIYLRLFQPACLKHQEHEPRVIPQGDYTIGIQKEYDPFSKRMREVAD